MANVKQVILTDKEEIGLNQAVEVEYADRYIFRGITISINANAITVAVPDKDNPYIFSESNVFEPQQIEIKTITREAIYEDYDREIIEEPVPVVNDITYTTADLDKRICDMIPSSINTDTLREFIRTSEKEFCLAEANVDNMTEKELNDYINFLDDLWTKYRRNY